MAEKGPRKLNLWDLREEFEEFDNPSELLADFLLNSSDAELWELLRSTLLAMRVRTMDLQDAKRPSLERKIAKYLRAIDLMYTFSRFIEVERRFPNKGEQHDILSKDGVPSMRDLLRKKDQSAREKRLKRKDVVAKQRGTVGILTDADRRLIEKARAREFAQAIGPDEDLASPEPRQELRSKTDDKENGSD